MEVILHFICTVALYFELLLFMTPPWINIDDLDIDYASIMELLNLLFVISNNIPVLPLQVPNFYTFMDLRNAGGYRAMDVYTGLSRQYMRFWYLTGKENEICTMPAFCLKCAKQQ